MFERLIRFAIEQRWLVLLAVVAMAAIGVFSYQKLPIDAVPDITNVQVQINTHAAGYGRRDRAAHHLPHRDRDGRFAEPGTNPIAFALRPVAGDGDLQDGTDIYFARQLVNERIQEARGKIPDGISPRWDRSRRVWAKSICGP